MAYVPITPPNVGDVTAKDTFFDLVAADLAYLASQVALVSTSGIINGSFEANLGANTAPTEWTLAIATGNSSNIETTAANVRHGAQAFSVTNPGGIGGGVSITTADLYPIGEGSSISLFWYMKSTSATVRNTVTVSWYDASGVFISSSVVYDNSTTNPTSWTWLFQNEAVPASGRFFTVQLMGVNNTTAGTTYWDGVTFTTPNTARQSLVYTGAGSYTYTPTQGVRFFKVRVMGGGAGGAGGHDNGANTGTDGTDGSASYIISTTYQGRGGKKGLATGGASASLAASLATNAMQFGSAASPSTAASGDDRQGVPNSNVMTAFGLQFVAFTAKAGNSATNGDAGANPGQGGGGGSGGGTLGSMQGGSGGGHGEYAEYILDVAALAVAGTLPPFNVVVGAGGNGGNGATASSPHGGNGGAGAAGMVIIEELA